MDPADHIDRATDTPSDRPTSADSRDRAGERPGDGPGHGRFPDDWLRRQRAFWEGFAAGASPAGLAAAGEGWAVACEQWWRQVESTVPAPLSGHLRAALEQTRLFVELAGGQAGAAGGQDPGSILARMLEDALGAAAGGAEAPGPERDAWLAAAQGLVAALAEIVQEALGAVRERLAREGAATPREVYAIYAEEIEAHYLARAGSDAFCRLVGDLLNAQVAVMAARRDAP